MRQINSKYYAAIIAGIFSLSSMGLCAELSEPSFSLGASSGVFQINYRHVSATDSVSGTTTASEPTLGAVLLFTAPLPVFPEYAPFGLAAQAGYNYNLPANDLAVSYSFANLLLKRDISIDMNGYLGAGALYSIWNQGIEGGIGWQIVAGAKNTEGLYTGFRYISVPGSRLTGSYRSTFLLSQIIFDLQYNF
jgi:hypothetical protein